MTEPENYAAAVRGELRAAQALASHLVDGAQLLGEERQQIADALRTALSLTDMRIVPADAIVLERPTDEANAELEADGHTLDPDNANRIVVAGAGLVGLLTGNCMNCGDQCVSEFSPVAARTLAAHIALAAESGPQ